MPNKELLGAKQVLLIWAGGPHQLACLHSGSSLAQLCFACGRSRGAGYLRSIFFISLCLGSVSPCLALVFLFCSGPLLSCLWPFVSIRLSLFWHCLCLGHVRLSPSCCAFSQSFVCRMSRVLRSVCFVLTFLRLLLHFLGPPTTTQPPITSRGCTL